jgi:hypothetical protein
MYLPRLRSSSKRPVKFIKQLRELLAEELMRFAETSALREGRVAEVVGVDAQAGGDVVADEAEPGELFRSESGSGILPLFFYGKRRDAASTLLAMAASTLQPLIEPGLDRVGKGFEEGLLFQGEAHEGDEISKAAGLRAAFDFPGDRDRKGVPEAVFRPGGVGVAELFLQLLEQGLRQALRVP